MFLLVRGKDIGKEKLQPKIFDQHSSERLNGTNVSKADTNSPLELSFLFKLKFFFQIQIKRKKESVDAKQIERHTRFLEFHIIKKVP